ncbi:hypothetical protein ACHAW6_001133 [Cyclotella cf. meneghiniana]
MTRTSPRPQRVRRRPPDRLLSARPAREFPSPGFLRCRSPKKTVGRGDVDVSDLTRRSIAVAVGCERLRPDDPERCTESVAFVFAYNGE